MNCKVVRTHLLQAEHPTRPGAEIDGHLVECAACRQHQQHLVELEGDQA